MQYIYFDLIIAALLLLFALRGYWKGLVLTLCGFLAIFVAFIGANMVSNALAEPVAAAIQPVVASGIHDTLSDYYQQSPAADASEGEGDWLSQLPLSELLEPLKDSVLYRGFADAIQQAVDDGMMAATANATRVITDYIAIQVARLVLFFVSFVLILIAWFFLSHTLDLAFKLPVLSTLNRWSGAAFGLFTGGLLLFIACWLLKDSFLPQQAIQTTYLLKFFCTFNPVSVFS